MLPRRLMVRMLDRLVAHRLAGDAGADAGQGRAAFLGDRLAAIVAFLGALALRGQRAGAQHGVLDRVVDLVLHRAVAGPSTGHFRSLPGDSTHGDAGSVRACGGGAT